MQQPRQSNCPIRLHLLKLIGFLGASLLYFKLVVSLPIIHWASELFLSSIAWIISGIFVNVVTVTVTKTLFSLAYVFCVNFITIGVFNVLYVCLQHLFTIGLSVAMFYKDMLTGR